MSEFVQIAPVINTSYLNIDVGLTLGEGFCFSFFSNVKVYELHKPPHTSANVSHKGFHIQHSPDKARKRILILNLPVPLFRTPASLSPSAQGCPESCLTEIQHSVTISIDIWLLPAFEQLFFCVVFYSSFSLLFFGSVNCFSLGPQLLLELVIGFPIKGDLWLSLVCGEGLASSSLLVCPSLIVCVCVRACKCVYPSRVSSAGWGSTAHFVSITFPKVFGNFVWNWSASMSKLHLLLVVRMQQSKVNQGLTD